MTPEGKVKAQIKELLKRHGVWFCMPLGQAYGRAGVPDFLCCVHGKFVGVEAKSATGKQTALQKLEGARIREAGGEYVVVSPQTFDQFKDMLNQWTE